MGLYQLSYSRLEQKWNIEVAKNSVKIIVLFAALISVVLTGCSDSYQTDLSQSQTRSRWHNSQGVVYMDQHNYTAGRSQFEKALALDSLFPTAHANLGIALYSLGKFDSARAELVACLALNPKHLHANYTLGLIDLAGGNNYERALASFQQVADIDGDDPLVQYHLGRTLAKLGRSDDALAAYGRAIELDENLLSAHYARAHELRQLGRTEDWRQALSVFDRLSKAGFEGVSTTYQGQGQYAEARVKGHFGSGGDDRMSPIHLADPVPITGLHRAHVAVDTDGDGLAELIGPSSDGNTLQILAKQSNGWTAASSWHVPPGIQAHTTLIGDIDDDGDLDLLVSSGQLGSDPTNKLLRQQNGRFVAEALGLEGSAHALGDIDHDGDYDVVSFSSGLRLASGNGTGGFSDITDEALGLEFLSPSRAVFTDTDNDRDVDLIAAGSRMALFSNNRDGTLTDLATERQLTQLDGALDLAVFDLLPDGYLDVVGLGPDALQVASNDAGRGYSIHQQMPVGDAHTVRVADLDNDGDLDVVLGGDDQVQIVLSSAGQLQAPQPIATGRPASTVVVNDLDGDGRIDIVAGNQVLMNETENLGHWVNISLSGLNSVADGVGSKVEIHTSTTQQKREVRAGAGDGRTLHVGIGSADSVEFIRILWPSGVRQAELATAADQMLHFEELNRKGTSCPILYAWDGTDYRFVSDFLGGAIIGYLTEPGQYYPPDTDEYVRIPHLQPRQGRYELQIGNQLEEILYLDAAELVAVDHPIGTTLFPNERLLSSPPYPSHQPYALADLRPPQRVTDHAGRDVTSALVAVDDEWYADFDHRPIHGYAAPYSLTLDLGDLSSWEHPVLVAHGWVDYAHSTSNWAASQRELSLFPPRLEVEDANGTWRLITTDMGTPAGLPKDMVFDLSDALTEDVDRVRLRITTSMSIYWDQFQAGRSVGQYSVQRARFDEADLHWRGYPVHESIHGTFAFRYDHSQVNTEAPWGTHAGAYTRFGDASELTDQIDDRFAIMFHGDELTLTVGADNFGPVREGWTRSFLFYADGFGKDMDFHSAHSLTVEPLPFHGMSRYPYGPDETYPQSPEHVSYRLDYNTRRIKGFYE